VLSLRSLKFILKISSLIPKPFFKKSRQTETTPPRKSVSQAAIAPASKEVYPLGAWGLPPSLFPGYCVEAGTNEHKTQLPAKGQLL